MMGLLKILLLEDNAADAEMIQRLLKKGNLQFESRLAADKDGFLQALDQFQPHIILADNSLPQFSATEALKIVQQRSLLIPFILITGTVSEEFAAGIIKSGADDYILKDRMNRLPVAIEAALRHKQDQKAKLKAQQELIESEEKYRKLVERVSDGFIALDKDWRYTYVNKKAGQMTHRDPQSLMGKHIWGEFPQAVGSATYKAFNKAMAQQRYVCNIDYYEPLNLWQENHVYPSPDGLSIFIRDISEKKRSQVELQTAKDRLFFHIDNSPLGFIEWDEQLKVKSWSKRAEEIFGWAENELIVMEANGLSNVYGEDLPELINVAHEMIAGGMQRSSIQHRNLTKDGRVIWCEWFNSVSKDKNGKVIIMSLVQDITERKKAEEDLRQSEERLKEAQALGRLSNWGIDLTTGVHTWSDAMYEIFSVSKTKVQPSAEMFLSFIHPEDVDFVAGKMKKALNSLQASAMDFRFLRGDGTIGHGYSEWKCEFRSNGQPMRLFGILQDITEQKVIEKELVATNEQLHSLSAHLQDIREEERIHIAREIHDELGQQLTGLKMEILWLNKKLQTDDEAIKQKINGIITLLDETVKSVRRISSNLRPSILDDLGLIAALEWHSQEVEKRSEIKVDFSTDMQEPQFPITTATGIFRIYQEVLTNAVRHANAHVITSRLLLRDERLILQVKDDGQGMDLAIARTRKTLGLIGIKERTFLLGGKFDIESEPGKGTEISISIPVPGP